MKHYVKRCPKCNLPLTYDYIVTYKDTEFDFSGSQDEYSACPKCNLAYIFKIRNYTVCNKYTVTEKSGTYHYEYMKGDK